MEYDGMTFSSSWLMQNKIKPNSLWLVWKSIRGRFSSFKGCLVKIKAKKNSFSDLLVFNHPCMGLNHDNGAFGLEL